MGVGVEGVISGVVVEYVEMVDEAASVVVVSVVVDWSGRHKGRPVTAGSNAAPTMVQREIQRMLRVNESEWRSKCNERKERKKTNTEMIRG